MIPKKRGNPKGCRYCIRYETGMCLRENPEAPKGPLYLRGADGRRYLLRFDCRKCEMQVINTEENKICPVTTPPTSISD